MKWYVWREELGIEPPTFQTLVGCSTVDREQSLFFFIFSEGSARARECRAAKPRDARNEGGSPRKLMETTTMGRSIVGWHNDYIE